LAISGRYDEVTEAVVQLFADRIADMRWAIFPRSSHMPHVEETAACLEVVEDFLAAHE
jgi:L-proline amide hydrolase